MPRPGAAAAAKPPSGTVPAKSPTSEALARRTKPVPPAPPHLAFDLSRVGQCRRLLGPKAMRSVVRLLSGTLMLFAAAYAAVWAGLRVDAIKAGLTASLGAVLLPLVGNATLVAQLIATFCGRPPLQRPGTRRERRLLFAARSFRQPQDGARCAQLLASGAFPAAGAASAWLEAAAAAQELPLDSLAVVLSLRPASDPSDPAATLRRHRAASAAAAWGPPASAAAAASAPPFHTLLGMATVAVVRDVPMEPLLAPGAARPAFLPELIDVAVLRAPLLGASGWFPAAGVDTDSSRSAKLAVDALLAACAATGATAGAVASPPPLLAAELLLRGAHRLPAGSCGEPRWVVGFPEPHRGCGSLKAFCRATLTRAAAADVARKRRRFAAAGGVVTGLPRGSAQQEPALLALLSAAAQPAAPPSDAPPHAMACGQESAQAAGSGADQWWAASAEASSLAGALGAPRAPPTSTMRLLLACTQLADAPRGAKSPSSAGSPRKDAASSAGEHSPQDTQLDSGQPVTSEDHAGKEAGAEEAGTKAGAEQASKQAGAEQEASDKQRPVWVLVARMRGAPVAALLLVADATERSLAVHSAAFDTAACAALPRGCSPFFALLHGALELGLVHGAAEVDLGPGAAGGAKQRLGAVPRGGSSLLLFADWRLASDGNAASVGHEFVLQERALLAQQQRAAVASAPQAPRAKRPRRGQAAAGRLARRLARIVRVAQPQQQAAAAAGEPEAAGSALDDGVATAAKAPVAAAKPARRPSEALATAAAAPLMRRSVQWDDEGTHAATAAGEQVAGAAR